VRGEKAGGAGLEPRVPERGACRGVQRATAVCDCRWSNCGVGYYCDDENGMWDTRAWNMNTLTGYSPYDGAGEWGKWRCGFLSTCYCTPGSCPNVSFRGRFFCPAGYYCGGVRTTPPGSDYGGGTGPYEACSAGHLCPEGSANSTGSGPCPPGFYCPAGSGAEPAGVCKLGYACPEGSYNEQGSSVGDASTKPCPEGYYQAGNETSRSACAEPCPSGMWCEEATGVSVVCPPGRVCPGGPSHLCPAGSPCESGVDPDPPTSDSDGTGETTPSVSADATLKISAAPGLLSPGVAALVVTVLWPAVV